MNKISKTNLKAFERAIYKDCGIKLKENEALEAAENLLAYMNATIRFSLENKSKVLKSSTRTP